MAVRKFNAWVVVMGGAIGFGLLARAADPVTPAGNDHVLRIGVMDAGKVYDSMTELKDLAAAAQARQAAFQAEGKKRFDEIQALVGEMRQLKEESPQWIQIRAQFEEKNAALKVQQQLWQTQIQRIERDALKTAHRRAVKAAEEVAAAEHLDLVISDANPDMNNSNTEQYVGVEFKQLLLTRAVFYSGPKADVTQKVLARVEADYAAAKGK